jgi:hypothetical protein
MQKLNSISAASTKRISLTVIASALALNLVACGGTGQDSPSATLNTSTTTFSGIAIDAALARSTVYLDANNNATRDPWEEYAFTDDEGYYSYNPKTKINYCESTTPDSQKIYCLKSSLSYTEVVVRIDGGYDLISGEPFVGSLSRRVDATSPVARTNTVISPITTLLTNIDTPTERSKVLTTLNLRESDLNINYFDTDGSNGINANLINASLKIQKTVSLLADRLNDNYSALNDETGVLNEPSSQVYTNLARELSSPSSSNLNSVLGDNQSLLRVLDTTEATIRNLFTSKELTLPQDLGSTETPNNLTRVVDISNQIPNLVDRLVPANETNLNRVIGGARALETVIVKGTNETNQNDTSIDNAIDFFTNPNNTYLSDVLIDTLAGDRADLSGLSKNNFGSNDLDTVDKIEVASSLNESATAFNMLAGKSLKVSELDLGYGPNNLQDREVELYFKGSTNDLNGTISACVKFIDDASTDGSLGDNNTRGELVKGYWSLLGATSSKPSSYSVLLTIEFLGTTYQAILKPNGDVMVDNTSYKLIRFDFDGGIKSWHSLNGLVTTSSVPTTNKQCEERLPSRVGL